MDTFQEKYNLPNLSEEEAENLNRPITADEIEAVNKKFPSHKSPGTIGFKGEFYTAFKGKLTPIIQRIFQKIQEDSRLADSFILILFIYFYRERKGRRKSRRETSTCDYLSWIHHWGPGPQPRHVP